MVKKTTSNQKFPVIGIGASAGGIESFKKFLGAIPENSGMAYILVQHLLPSHESLLPAILKRSTNIPVTEITDNCKIVPNHIYVIPENKVLEVTDHVLKLTTRDNSMAHMPIDVFFSSLARIHGPLAAGVVLSGTARDGTAGLRDIKEYEGITFAENPKVATWKGMPKSAIEAGVVDFIMAPAAIPAKLIKIYKAGNLFIDDEEIYTDDNGLKGILSIVLQNSGVDFNYYKRPTILRRIKRRMAINQIAEYQEYLKVLKENKSEQEFLLQDLLIKVTSFFRDPEIFEELKKDVFPKLLEDRAEDNPLRIWIAGCATGEEVYSMVITIFETLYTIPASRNKGVRIQVFASDLSETAIKKARTGVYGASELQPLTDIQRQKYFTRTDGSFKVIKSIRDIIVFTEHNFLKDPPFGNVDFISCRNVFIYFDTFLQKKALSTFHYALKEIGYLLMGKSETTGRPTDLFAPFSKNNKIYLRKSGAGRFVQSISERNQYKNVALQKEDPIPKAPRTDFRKSAESILMTDFTPASIIVDEYSEIVHINGNIQPFIGLSSGRPTYELMKIARKELAFELRNALHKAKDSQEKVRKIGIPVKIDKEQFAVDLEIIPLTDIVDQYYLIIFWKKMASSSLLDKVWKKLNPSFSSPQASDVQQRNTALEKEMEQLREDMRSISEEQEANNEELQSANEELLSTNEEMQSLNEELETSKEELQSTNEELIVINHELMDKQGELNDVVNYSDDIISTLREPFLILDKDFRIQKANTSYYEYFKIDKQEVEGRHFFEIQNEQWNHVGLKSMLHDVLPKRRHIINEEIEFYLQNGEKKIFSFNTREINREWEANKLILMEISDITSQKAIERDYITTIEELNKTNEQLDQFVHVASHDLQEPLRKIITFANLIIQKEEIIPEMSLENYLEKIKSSSERMSRLIKNMLTYARLANHEMFFEQIDLNNVIENILSDFEILITQKNAEIKIAQLPVIEGIPQQINQLFYNLISNALKFSKNEEVPVISIAVRRILENELEKYPILHPEILNFEIIVRDNGIGFHPDYQQQIFTIFQRLNASSQYLGTGIGLALCRKIVENHHGKIFADSKEGEGSAFHIIMPSKQPQKK